MCTFFPENHLFLVVCLSEFDSLCEPTLGTVKVKTKTGCNTPQLRHSHSHLCFDNTSRKRDQKWFQSFSLCHLISKNDPHSGRTRMTPGKGINATLKVIPRSQTMFFKQKRGNKETMPLDVFICAVFVSVRVKNRNCF